MAEQIGVWHRQVAMADDHPLAARASLTIDMLAEQPLIFMTRMGLMSRFTPHLPKLWAMLRISPIAPQVP